MTRSARKRADIIAAARQEFLSQGFRETSMDRVAKRADVSKRTVYNHFPSKETLFRAVAVELIQEMRQAARVAFDPEQSLEAQLRLMATREVDLITSESYVASFRVLLVESFALPGIASEALASIPEDEDPVARWFQAAAENGRLAPHDVAIAARQFYSLLKGVFFWPVIAGYGAAPLGEERELMIDSTVRMLLNHYSSAASN